jgi:hypothetical protein
MTYLQLINAVLTRLREEEITAEQLTAVPSNPYWKFIGSAVNDAKARVEDAWQWSALRGTDTFQLKQGTTQVVGPAIALPNSKDNHYIIKRVNVYPNSGNSASFTGIRSYLDWVNVDRMRLNYQDPENAGSGRPAQFAVTGRATVGGALPFPEASVGNIELTLWPFPTDETYWVEIDRVNHQADLVAADTELLVPSLPVFTLATALASRERGEVGGTPTSELFGIADSHLADAIAQDSSLYANELDWWADTALHNTNVRFA